MSETDTGTPDAGAPIDARVAAIERVQERQDSKLDRIIEMIPGLGTAGSDTAVTRADDPAAGAADMTAQMEQAVRNVQAEAAAAAGQAKAPEPETTPREVMVRGKEKLQRALFGGDPKR